MSRDFSLGGASARVPVSRQEFVEAMSRAANGVNVLTSVSGERWHGLTISAASSVTAEPPTLLACIHHESPTAAAIVDSRVMCLNLLAETQQPVAQMFAERDVDREQRFTVGHWSVLRTGAPALDGALASFDCEVVSSPRVGTHCVLIGQVVATRVGSGRPLVYTRRSYARLDSGG